MASFWSKVVRAIDQFLGDPPASQSDLDPAIVEEAIRLIQEEVDADRRQRLTRRLRVSDLSPERQEQLAARLAQLLREKRQNGEKAA